MTLIEQIKDEVKKFKDGLPKEIAEHELDKLRVSPRGCPHKSRMIDELQELDKYTLHIAYHIGLIGSGIQEGTLVADSRDLNKPNERTYVYHYPNKTVTFKH